MMSKLRNSCKDPKTAELIQNNRLSPSKAAGGPDNKDEDISSHPENCHLSSLSESCSGPLLICSFQETDWSLIGLGWLLL